MIKEALWMGWDGMVVIGRTCRYSKSTFGTNKKCGLSTILASLFWQPCYDLRKCQDLSKLHRYISPGTFSGSEQKPSTFGYVVTLPNFQLLILYYNAIG